MAVDHFLQVPPKIRVQGYRGTTFFENTEGFREQARTRPIARQQPGDDTGIRLDENLIALPRTGYQRVEVVRCLGARDVNDRHVTMIAEVFKTGVDEIVAVGASRSISDQQERGVSL